MHKILVIIIGLICFCGHAQTDNATSRIGFALNSSVNGEVYPIRLVPSLTFLKGKSQFELGFGIHPFIRSDQNIYSGELNYKYFPNGVDQKFSMYLISRLSYIHNPRKTFYPTTYNYLFLNGGYGFQISPFKNAYMGTNISAGLFTYDKKSETPYTSFAEKDLFDNFNLNFAFQFNIGYRF